MDTPFDSTLESDIKELMKEVPAPVRAFFASGKVEIVAKNLMQKYRLHIDQGAVVEREVILLLLGLKGPEDFAKTLSEEAKLDQQTVNSIVQDVNAQIFVPLRDEMRKGTPSAVPTPPKATQGTAHPQQVPAVAPKYAPIPKFPHLLQNKISLPQSFPASSFQPPVSRLLEDHEEPHIEFKKVPASPPANLPGAIHHPPLPKPPRASPEATQGTAPPPPPKPKPASSVQYSSDPYREPIE